VIPIDEATPKGRLILPQQQVIRDLLDGEANAIMVKETQLESALKSLNKAPALVITDSQIFEEVNNKLPPDILLTSFSILFARAKGVLEVALEGAYALKKLKEGNKVLISEGCTHHRQCNDIGTVKLPRWIQEYTGCKLDFEFTSGTEYPGDLSGYSCIIHCGGCMLSEREVRWRGLSAKEQNIPFTNYGITIALIHGILERSIEPFYGVCKNETNINH
jgi:[FeFe] hydrogenase H-cluster maturation GTPase HydF